MKRIKQSIFLALTVVVGAMLSGLALLSHPVYAATENGSIGIQGKVSAAPPTTAATISTPSNGQSYNNLPITVAGLCTGTLLVKLFKNNVFSGSVTCKNGSYTIQTDLFSGENELVARVYDDLDQVGPDSNKVVVTFKDPSQGAGTRVSLTSNYAKRGANPGEALTWPIILSGGVGPYAISVDWGDGKPPDLLSQQFPGTFTIKHSYDSPGVYNIVVKATDVNGGVSYIQLVGIANGALSQDSGTAQGGGQKAITTTTTTKTAILWQPAAILVPFIVSTFWLGKRHELKMIRRRIERGDRPF